MSKVQKRQKRQGPQRLSRKTKKTLINSIGREQYHEMMSAHAHNSETKAKAEIFSRVAEPPYQIQSGKMLRLKAFGNSASGK